MDERKRQVLRTIVTLYTSDGEPIGSQLLSEHLGLAVSTATLRNEMAALTRLGLLEQPHTSAGRVPSGAGYRYYIDHLMGTVPLTAAERAAIDKRFDAFDYDPPRLVQAAARSLSEHSGLMVAATTPRADDMRIVHFQLTQVGRNTAAVLAVTSAGGVVTRVARAGGTLSPQAVRGAEEVINRALGFLTPADITPAVAGDLVAALGGRAGLLAPLADAALQLLTEAGSAVTAVEGIAHLLRYPVTAQNLGHLLEFGNDHARLARSVIPQADRLTVTLGGEDTADLPAGVAVMARSYVAGGGRRGGIAIIGPDRMPYGRLAPVLEYYALLLGQAATSGK